ncbi:MAG TPA: DNRLRE domain-containing protein [Gaiellaceae bacterium]|jgi:hypothetical protein
MARTLTQHGRLAWGPIALLAVAATAGGASAAKAPASALRVLTPVADTYVTAARPGANFGRASALRVDGVPETTAFVRFRPGKIGGQVTSVILLLHSRSAGRAAYAVRRVSGVEWRERTLTYANAPDLSLRYASSKPVRRGAWSAIEVGSFVSAGDGGEVSLAITTRGGRELAFGSRESRTGPRLVVRVGPPLDVDDLLLKALGRH